MKSKALVLAVVVAGLAAAGALLTRMVSPVWLALRGEQPVLRLDSTLTAAGQGAMLGLLGGFRALCADVTWVRMYVLWERREIATVDTLVHLVPAMDPRPVYFWLNGARIVAYDLPVWRIEAAGGYDAVPEVVQQRINREQAAAALAHLAAAMRFHPTSPDLWIERANIELNRLGDLAAAAESYRRAWEQPHGPYYAARLHAEMLRRLGRKAEALAWLIKLHPALPPNDETAAADLVLRRIRELERELGVAAERTYDPPR